MIKLVCPTCKLGQYAHFNCNLPDCTDGRYLIPDPKETDVKNQRLLEALNLATSMLMAQEPGDSRDVSDEVVALCSVVCGFDDDKTWNVIREAIRKLNNAKA